MSKSKPASIAIAIEYITHHLIMDKLIMREATNTLGWTFPRIRSRAQTICKQLNGKLLKIERGVYTLEPLEDFSSYYTTSGRCK